MSTSCPTRTRPVLLWTMLTLAGCSAGAKNAATDERDAAFVSAYDADAVLEGSVDSEAEHADESTDGSPLGEDGGSAAVQEDGGSAPVREDGGAAPASERAPILGWIKGTTARTDYTLVGGGPLGGFPYELHGFPYGLGINGQVGETLSVPPVASEDGGRSVMWYAQRGHAYEVCAKSANGQIKLRILRTGDLGPEELDETIQTAQAGDEVCTRGRLKEDGPFFLLVKTQPIGAQASVRSRVIELDDGETPDSGFFAACAGRALTTAELAKLRFQDSRTSGLGTYTVQGRTRECARFRGCTSWQSHDASKLRFKTCSSCTPSFVPAASGELQAYGYNAVYELVLQGTPVQQPSRGLAHCPLGATRCSVKTDATEPVLSVDGVPLEFVAGHAITDSCVRVSARGRQNGYDADSGRLDWFASDSFYREYEVVFRGNWNVAWPSP